MIIFASLALSLHCAAMCGPLACSVLGQRAHLKNRGIWLYNLGRLISYMAAGTLLGTLTAGVGQAWTPLGQGISMVIGFALIMAGLWRLFPKLLPRKFQTSFQFNQKLMTLVSKTPPHYRDFAFGLVTVLLPCMTLTPALAMAAASQSALFGFLFMAAFGIGTIPIMLAATNVPLVIYRKLSPKMTQWLVGLFLLVAGIITFFRDFLH